MRNSNSHFYPLIPYTNPFIAKKSILPTENVDFDQKFLLIIDNHTKWHPKTPGVKGLEKSALSAKPYFDEKKLGKLDAKTTPALPCVMRK